MSVVFGSGFLGKYLIARLNIEDKGEERESTLEFEKDKYADGRIQLHMDRQDSVIKELATKITILEAKNDVLVEKQMKSIEERAELHVAVEKMQVMLDIRTAEAADLAGRFNQCEERSAKLDEDNALILARCEDMKDDIDNTRRILSMEREKRILFEAELIRRGILKRGDTDHQFLSPKTED